MSFLIFTAVLALAPTLASTPPPTGRAATYDATGTWTLDMGATHLLAGDCDVTDDEGYTESVTIVQTAAHYTFRTGFGLQESGTVAGGTYHHASQQQGRDISGLAYTVSADTRFTLTSADSARGRTRLDVQYADGTRCIFELELSGARRPHGPTTRPHSGK